MTEAVAVSRAFIAVPASKRRRNLRVNLKAGYIEARPFPARSTKLAIVGSGPSLVDYLDELRTWPGHIWAINGAFDYLVSQGINPHAFVGLDADPSLVKHLQNPTDAIYLLAGTCSPKAFRAVQDRKVMIWFAAIPDSMPPADKHVCPGMISCVIHAAYLGYLFGFRDETLFGVDSSFNDKPYAYETGQRVLEPGLEDFEVEVDGRRFRTQWAMAHQANALMMLKGAFPAKIEYRCGGYVGALMKSNPIKLEDMAA